MYHLKIFITILVFFFSSCAEKIESHGLSKKKIDNIELEIGVTSKKNLIDRYGPPVFESVFNKNILYYVSHTSSYKNFDDRKTKRLQVIEIIFDENEIIQNYKKYSEKNSYNIKVSDKDSDDADHNSVTFWKEIINNLSRSNVKN